MEKRFFTTLKRLLAILNQKRRQYTAFNTHQGSFEFKRMSFGLCNAGATFQRQRQQLLEEYIEFARNYIEDIIISSRNFEEHLVQIEIYPFAYRTSKQKLQRKHHSRLLYGRYVRLPSDIDKWSTKDSFVDEIDKAWKLAQKLIKKSAKNSEKLSEPSHVINYQKDDWVRVEKPATQVGLKRKFRRDLWSEPVQILQVNDTENVLIKETPETWVHKNRIKPAETVLRSGRISRPPIRYRAGYTQREK